MTFKIENEFAVIVVSALDGKPIQQAKRLLVSTSARAQWSGMEFDESHGVITKSGKPPFLMEPVIGTISLKHEPMAVYRLSSSGRRLGELPTRKTGEGMAFDLLAASRCMHYELVAK